MSPEDAQEIRHVNRRKQLLEKGTYMQLGIIAALMPLIIIVAIALALLLIAHTAYRKASPDEVLVVSGMGKIRYVTGNSTIVIPFLQQVDHLSLGVVQCLLTTTEKIPTNDAILITAKAVANFQISSNPELMERAAKNYLNQSKENMMQDVSEVLLGKMREVIGEMPLVDIMRDRAKFNAKVAEGARDDMAALGLELTTFNVQDFQDYEGVIKNMGADQSNEIRKQAQFARIQADQEVAMKQNELDLKEAELKKQADQAKAEADLVFETVTAERTRELRIAEQEAAIANEAKKIELAEKAVAVRERELEADVKKRSEAERYAAEQKAAAERYVQEQAAEAELYRAMKDAEAVERAALAEAKRIQAVGEAEGEAEKLKGEGIAAATKAQVAAYNAMENGNLLADRYIEIMPSLAEAVARPLSAVDSITMYGEGNSAALVGNTSRMVAQLNSALGDVLGIDLKDVVGGLVAGTAAGSAAGAAVEAAKEG